MLIKKGSFGLIILAAGGSQRFGRLKQLVKIGDKTLLEHTIQVAENSKVDHIVVVLGHQSDHILPILNQTRIQVVENIHWENGMASSIHAGLQSLIERNEDMEGLIIMVCDQPYVNTELLNELILQHETSRLPIVASMYNNIYGVPAFFHSSLFDELLNLEGDKGAQGIIKRNQTFLTAVEFPEGELDIDTVEDYEKFMNAI